MKTKEELTALKNEVETLNKKLAELSEEELLDVTGGTNPFAPAGPTGPTSYNPFVLDNSDDLELLAGIVNEDTRARDH